MKGRTLIAVGVVLIAAGVAIVLAVSRSSLASRVQATNCGNQMSSIGCAARVWADDAGTYPSDFMSLSNEIVTPIVLHCPADTSRPILRLWADVNTEKISYEILAPGMAKTNIDGLFFRCKVHGHLGYGDGTVFDGKKRRTKVFF